MKPKILILFGSLILFSAIFFSYHQTNAGTGDNVWGYAWSENIGWIKFNNCADPSNPATCAAQNYGVHVCRSQADTNPHCAAIPNTEKKTGKLAGYAWSENIGWVQLDPEGPYPVGPNYPTYSTCLNFPNPITNESCNKNDPTEDWKIRGWARAVIGKSKKTEYYEGGGAFSLTSSPPINGIGWWVAQVFTIGSTGPATDYQLDSIKLPLVRQWTPGNIVISIQGAVPGFGGNLSPDGIDLAGCVGSADGDNLPEEGAFKDAGFQPWTDIYFSAVPGCNLLAGQSYAIVAKAPAAAGGSSAKWAMMTVLGGYPGGSANQSINGGVFWIPLGIGGSDLDFAFSLFSKPATGGWDGWIKLSGLTTFGQAYGARVDITVSPAQVRGWSWGGDPEGIAEQSVIGWVSFNKSNTGAASDYKVLIDLGISNPPTANNLQAALRPGTDCGPSPSFDLSWTFSDPNNYTQSAYQIQVDTDIGFAAPIIVDSGVVPGASNTYTVSGLTFGTNYFWRLKVWNSNDDESVWINGLQFTTGSQGPQFSFDWDPLHPSVNFPINFSGTCIAHTCSSWDWDFDDGAMLSNQNVIHTYTTAGIYDVSLTVTDKTIVPNKSCNVTRPVDVSYAFLPLPFWKEIPPF